jgi:hypothetical protein
MGLHPKLKATACVALSILLSSFHLFFSISELQFSKAFLSAGLIPRSSSLRLAVLS